MSYPRNFRTCCLTIVFLSCAGIFRAFGSQVITTVIDVVYKATQKPAELAIVEVAEGEKVLFTDHTGADGKAKCPGLVPASKYFFKARKSGYRRTYVHQQPKESIRLELVKKYGPAIAEGK